MPEDIARESEVPSQPDSEQGQSDDGSKCAGESERAREVSAVREGASLGRHRPWQRILTCPDAAKLGIDERELDADGLEK